MLKILDIFERLLVGWFIFASAMLAFLLVILRYFFGKGLTWGSEAVILLVVWAAFFGAGIAIREKSHIELEVVRDLLPPAFRLPVVVLADLLCVGLMLVSYLVARRKNMRSGEKTTWKEKRAAFRQAFWMRLPSS